MTAADTLELAAEAERIRGAVDQVAKVFHVFPIDHPAVPYCDGIKTREHDPRTCTDRGKHPTCKWSEWSTQDPDKWGTPHYFGGDRPHNIGIDCGKSSVLVVDEDAEGEWDRVCAHLGVEPPETFTVRTAKGRHVYFRQPAGAPFGNGEGALRGFKINIRGAGGYVVGPGSLHATGVIYKIIVLADVAPAPDRLIKTLQGKPSSNGRHGDDGERATSSEDRAWWREGAIPKGNRHHALVAAAGWCLWMGLKYDEAKPIIRDVWSRFTGDPVPWEQAEARLDDVYGRYEAGDRLGERRGDDRDGGGDDGDHHHQELALADGHRPTDSGNADRLVALAAGRIRYVHAWGKWIVYQHGRWVIDENDALITERARGVARGLFKQAAALTSKKKREAMWAWATRSESSSSVAAMVRLARGAPGILVEHEQLDADPYMLNVRNGTIDLRTGILQAPDPAHLITVQCPVAYDPEASAPLWAACVDRWQPDPTVRDYIQVRAGAGATGRPTETVDVDYGGGGNGKSKFWGAIQHVLGDYAVVPHKSLLVAQRHEQHATVVARLFRKRLAVASETRAADVLDDEQVKNLTGGDRLSGRRMREDPWEFQPTHTLVMFSNHKPAVNGRDEGIWRRLRLVPWEVTIPEDERDPDLATKLEAEAPGILAWVVGGARQFIAEGLTPPPAVRAATDAYRASEDTIGRFIADVLRIGDGWVMSAEIRAELEAWCDEQGVEPPRMNEIAEALRGLGCRDGGRKVMNGKRGTIWHGVRIAEFKAATL